LSFNLTDNPNINKTILNVVIVYLTTTILLVITMAIFYVQNQKQQQFNLKKEQIDVRAKYLIKEFELLHDNIVDENAIYPIMDDFKSAIYDIDKNLIYSTIKKDITPEDKSYFTKDNFIYFEYHLDTYYLGAKYLIIEVPRIFIYDELFSKSIIIVSLIILFLVFTSFALVKVLIRPLSNNLMLLDRFIKDATHELNTPLSAILNNIEMIDPNSLDEKNLKKINRIKIGAITISNIYKDLSFLLLNNKIESNNQNLDISSILHQRLEYFKILTKSKNLKFTIDIDDGVLLFIDNQKIQRLFDNLISNSIKYSHPNTDIKITLKQHIFTIEDSGIGMSEDEIKDIFIRYKRFSSSVGGFGIGYNIIHTIIKEYNIDISIESKKNIGTKVELKW